MSINQKHHDHHDNGTEESNIDQMIDIVIEIDRKDIQQKDKSQ